MRRILPKIAADEYQNLGDTSVVDDRVANRMNRADDTLVGG
jgi:hypothetical protein